MNAISQALIHISSVSPASCSLLIMKYRRRLPEGEHRRHRHRRHQSDGNPHCAPMLRLTSADSISGGDLRLTPTLWQETLAKRQILVSNSTNLWRSTWEESQAVTAEWPHVLFALQRRKNYLSTLDAAILCYPNTKLSNLREIATEQHNRM